MDWFEIVKLVLFIFVLLSFLPISPHIIYGVLGVFARGKTFAEAQSRKKFAVVCCAKDEEAVIGKLLQSLNKQNYDRSLFEVFVIADCCTDDTARVAREAGATVFQLHEKKTPTKGEALDFGLKKMLTEGIADRFDGVVFFDADNLAGKNFLHQVNNCMAQGNQIVIGYRNTKNFADSFYASGTALLILREMTFMHPSRQLLGTSTHMSGTGVAIDFDLIREIGGWPYRTLTEDLEFSMDMVTRGKKVVYCKDAEFFDEQPVDKKTSDRQKERWLKGAFNANKIYKKALLKRFFTKGSWSAMDLQLQTTPAQNLLAFSSVLYVLFMLASWAFGWASQSAVVSALLEVAVVFAVAVGIMFFMSAITVLKNWKKIKATGWQKVKSIFAFPFFLIGIAKVGVKALFKKRVVWEKIHHVKDISIEELDR